MECQNDTKNCYTCQNNYYLDKLDGRNVCVACKGYLYKHEINPTDDRKKFMFIFVI